MGDRPAKGELIELQRTLYASKNPTRRWLHQSRRDRINAELERAAAGGGTGLALEVGPGAGPYIGVLCDRFDRVTATDVQAAFLEHVETAFADRENLTVLEDDITATKLEAGSFDLVLCTEVIEHVPDPGALLDGIVSVLRPGGTLILSTPQPYSPLEIVGRIAFRPGMIQIARAVYREPVLPTGHISLTSRREIGAMLQGRGLEIRSSFAGGMYLPLVAEVGGERALRLEQRLERLLTRRGGRAAGLLWTQYWTATKPAV